jgi:predicted dehydrogenase
MDNVRIGIVGLGTMGSAHANYLLAGDVDGAELTAVSSIFDSSSGFAKKQMPGSVTFYDRAEALFASGKVDAVLIATPHYSHPELAQAAFRHGLHVLIEKPAGVYTRQVREMNAAAAESGNVFGIMLNQRTHPVHRKLKELIDSGELGEIKRTNWIITSWYRPQSYYDAGGWRATWIGEGGGVLLNQCPHQLDLWQWICGMPKSVHAFCGFGKYHQIEVEDDVTAYVEYENGATGVFITSTGEAPGSNRLEIAGDRGKIVMENNQLTFWRTRVSEREFNRDFKGGFGEPESWKCDIPVIGTHEEHKDITRSFVDAIRNGTPLEVPGEEGLKSLELANAVLLSGWLGRRVDLPIDDELFYEQLQEKIKNSASAKDASQGAVMDVNGTH